MGAQYLYYSLLSENERTNPLINLYLIFVYGLIYSEFPEIKP